MNLTTTDQKGLITKTSEEWNAIHQIKILDPDGWDRRNFKYSFYKELITETEFMKRISISTIRITKEILDKVKENK